MWLPSSGLVPSGNILNRKKAMIWKDAIELEGIRALDRREPATVSELVGDLRKSLPKAGLMPAEKVDEVLVRGMLEEWRRHEPSLAVNDFAPDDVDPLGRVRPGAERIWFRTEAADVREAQLARLNG
jgi:hypothetical protein